MFRPLYTQGEVGSTAGTDAVQKRETSYLPGIEPRQSSPQPIAIHEFFSIIIILILN
jgi:hypothetical protein